SDYPLHLGITEAGTLLTGSIKSAIGIGMLLADGIGDTIRVSLAADPVEEVKVGFEILKSLELRHRGVNVIACPTCGRVEIDVVKLANELEKRLGHIRVPLNVSVLGCVVNGIGEGKEADIGIAGGEGVGILFKHGILFLVWMGLPLYNPHTRRRTQVVKGAVCKTAMRRFDPARRLHYFTHPTPAAARPPLFPRHPPFHLPAPGPYGLFSRGPDA